MNVTPAEMLLILQGKASPELQAQFLKEADDPQSHLNGVLRGVAAWAKVNLNPNCPSPPTSGVAAPDAAPDAGGVPTYRVLRKAALLDEAERRATPADLVDYVRGAASPEVAALVKKALEDPTSELSEILKRLKKQGN